MPKLNEDVLFIILKELQYDVNSLYSCLLARKAWSEIIIPILWKNPWKILNKGQKKSLFNVIISHLSNEAKENLRIQGVEISTSQQKLLFNYISFCRYLKLRQLEDLIGSNVKESNVSIIMDEILKLFINENTKITHLYILQRRFNHQIHLISGAEHCFSELKFLKYKGDDINHQHKSLKGLSRISKSIKTLKLNIYKPKEITGVIKLIEAQKNLNEVKLESKDYLLLFCKDLEDSLVKHADTIQYLKISRHITKTFVILTSLEMELRHWDYLEVAHLPALKILRVKLSYTTEKLEYLASLIENTNGNLTEIVITNYGDYDNKKLVETIYQNCPNLRYLRLMFNNNNFSKLEKLLINCQYLDGLFIDILDGSIDWNNLFEIIARSSPASLFKFKFRFINCRSPTVESLSLFFDNWKGRHPMHPMLLQVPVRKPSYYYYLIDGYKEVGIVKKNDFNVHDFEDFEWIQPKNSKT